MTARADDKISEPIFQAVAPAKKITKAIAALIAIPPVSG